MAVAAGDGVTPAYDVAAAAAGAWADEMTLGRDVGAGRQEDHALVPEITEKKNYNMSNRQNKKLSHIMHEFLLKKKKQHNISPYEHYFQHIINLQLVSSCIHIILLQ